VVSLLRPGGGLFAPVLGGHFDRFFQWVKEMKTKIKIELPQFCTTKDEQIKGYERLVALRT